MEGSDLNYYFNWIKTQLSSQVKDISFSIFARNVTSMLSQAIYGNYGKWQKESYIKIMPFWTRWVSQITLRYGTLLHFFFLWLASAQPFLSFLPLGIFLLDGSTFFLGGCQDHTGRRTERIHTTPKSILLSGLCDRKRSCIVGRVQANFGAERLPGAAHTSVWAGSSIVGEILVLGEVSRYF